MGTMKPTDRSAYVHSALHHIGNRFLLCRHAAAATRILHVPGERVAETMNLALAKVRRVG